jgi:dTDP-4-dehydrorhamnose reductase
MTTARRTILITGGAGMLATDMAQYLQGEAGFDVVAPAREKLDVTRSDQVREALAAHRPQFVIHTPVCHVEDSEGDPEQAFQVNAWSAGILARECQKMGIEMVHISTCGVFGDEVRPYNEYDPVVLKTVYARSKYAGEQLVRDHCSRHYILRLGWLFGGRPQHQRNFVAARYREALQKPVMVGAGDKFGSPTYTKDVATLLPALLESGQHGLYHVANQGGCSRAEYVQGIVKEFGLSTKIEPVDSSYFPRRADVPDCEVLASFNLTFAGLPALQPWEEGLARYVHVLRKELEDG